MTGNKYGSAAAVRREVAEYLRPPRRMPVAEGIKQFMFVPAVPIRRFLGMTR